MRRLSSLLIILWVGSPVFGASCPEKFSVLARAKAAWGTIAQVSKKPMAKGRRTAVRAWNSKGLRIILKPPKDLPPNRTPFWAPYQAPQSRWALVRGLHHFVDLPKWPVRLATYWKGGKAWDFTLLQGLVHYGAKVPTRWASAKLGWEREPTLAITLPMELVLGAVPWVLYFTWTDEEIKKRAVASAKEHGKDWDQILKSDFRYDAFYSARKKEQLSEEKAHLAVAVLNQMSAEYFQRRSNEGDSAEALEYYLSLPLFSDIAQIRDEGLQRPGFLKSPSHEAIPSEATVNKLMESRHKLLKTQELVQQWIHNPPDTATSKDFANSVSALQRDPYVKELVALEREGVISKNELSVRIQEDYFWRDRFESWKILGVQKLKKQDGEFTDQPLTLPAIRAELRSEMGSR